MAQLREWLRRARMGAFTLLAGLPAGCASVNYHALEPGFFTGALFVMWVDEGGHSGDGTFLFVPDPGNPLTFHRHATTSPGAVVRPAMMYTDGGSIPKVAQMFNGLSPWGYAPAYMIHDWLFTARHCLLDGTPDERHLALSDVSFEESAAILGEAIRTLVASGQVKPNDLAGWTITRAVETLVARNLWDKPGACRELQVKPEHAAAANAAIPGASIAARRTAPTGTPPARVVTRIAF